MKPYITDPKLVSKITNHIYELSAEELAKLASQLFDENYTYIGEVGVEGIDTFKITPKTQSIISLPCSNGLVKK